MVAIHKSALALFVRRKQKPNNCTTEQTHQMPCRTPATADYTHGVKSKATGASTLCARRSNKRESCAPDLRNPLITRSAELSNHGALSGARPTVHRYNAHRCSHAGVGIGIVFEVQGDYLQRHRLRQNQGIRHLQLRSDPDERPKSNQLNENLCETLAPPLTQRHVRRVPMKWGRARALQSECGNPHPASAPSVPRYVGIRFDNDVCSRVARPYEDREHYVERWQDVGNFFRDSECPTFAPRWRT
jgi:hypothetical protein